MVRSPIKGYTWTRRALSSRAQVESRLAGLLSSHSAPSCFTVILEPRGSIQVPRLLAVRCWASNSRASRLVRKVLEISRPSGPR